MKRVSWGKLGLAAVTVLALTATAQATQITGQVTFSGFLDPVPTATSLDTATGVNFRSSPPTEVWVGSGDYNGLPASVVTFTNITSFDLGGVTNPLWTFQAGALTYSFYATTLSLAHQSTTDLNLIADGTFYIKYTATGLDYRDPTPGLWNLSAVGPSGPNGFSFTSVSDTDAGTVPEPATLVLFGTGLVGLAAAARRTRGRKTPS